MTLGTEFNGKGWMAEIQNGRIFFCPKVMLERIDGKEKSAKWELIFNECSLGYG